MSEEPTMKLTDFDYLTGDHHLQMMKAALPYVNIPEQRFLSILVKFQELRRTVSLFENEENAAVGICSLGQNAPRSPLDMMNAIKPYADSQEQDFIDVICNFLQGWRIGNQYRQELRMQEAARAGTAKPEDPPPNELPPEYIEPENLSQEAAGRLTLEQIKNLLPPDQQVRFETASLLMQAMRQMA